MKRLLLVWLLIGSFPALACDRHQPEVLSQLASRSVQYELWLGQFDQWNYLSALSAPLKSQGEIYVKANHGMVWQVNSPIESRMVITEQGIDFGDGLVSASRMTAALLQKVLVGDFSGLEAQFFVASCHTSSGWQIHLEPKSGFLREYVLAVDITGKDYVERMVVQQGTNNRTEIAFSMPLALENLPSSIEGLFVEH